MEPHNGGMKYIHTNCDYCGKPVTRNAALCKYANVKKHFCNTECKAAFQRLSKPVTREWLEEHYVAEGLDCAQIGRMVNRDPKSVWNWLKDFGIPTRPRGASSKTKFAKGHKLGVGRTLPTESRKKISDKCKERGSVPYMVNGQHWLKTVPRDQHPKWKGGITPERQAFYASPEWKRVERLVKKRDKHTCQRCGKVKTRGEGQQFDVHHIVSFACVKLRAAIDNLVYLCESCHYWVHGPENTERRFIRPWP